MAKKRKIRADRILILVLTLVLLVLLALLGVKYLFKGDENEVPENNQSNTHENEENGKTFEVVEYEVYKKNDELGFGFVVANMKFADADKNNYELGSFITSEGIKLNETSEYEKKLKTSSYDFDSLHTVLDIPNDNSETTARIFVPFIDSLNNIAVTDSVSGFSVNFDLSSNQKDLETLKKETKEETIVSKEYTFTCAKPYIEDMMKHNDEPYDSSMLSVYAFKLTCESIANDVKILSARFIDKDGNVTDAYDSTYSSVKIANILNRSIKPGDTYALFFELYSNAEDHVAYEGTIELSFSDGSVERVSTLLN